MGVLSKGTDFSNGDQVTDTNLDNLVDNATFTSSAVDGSTTDISGAGAIIVRDGGITNSKLATGALNDAGVTATGSTTARSLSDRFAEIINVKDFGAVGDGVTDDTAAIQAAIDYVETQGGGVIGVPVGTFMAKGLTLPSNVVIQGADMELSVIKHTASSVGNVVETENFDTLLASGEADTEDGSTYNFGLKNLTIDGNRENVTGSPSSTSGWGCRLYGQRLVLDNVRINGIKGSGLHTALGNSSDKAFDYRKESKPGYINNLFIYAPEYDGWIFNGPSDIPIGNVFVGWAGNSLVDSTYDSLKRSLVYPLERPTSLVLVDAGGAELVSFVHVFGNKHGWGVRIGDGSNTFRLKAEYLMAETCFGGVLLNDGVRAQISILDVHDNDGGDGAHPMLQCDSTSPVNISNIEMRRGGDDNGSTMIELNGNRTKIGTASLLGQASAGHGIVDSGVANHIGFAECQNCSGTAYDATDSVGFWIASGADRVNANIYTVSCTVGAKYDGSGGSIADLQITDRSSTTPFDNFSAMSQNLRKFTRLFDSTNNLRNTSSKSQNNINSANTSLQTFSVSHNLLWTPATDEIMLTPFAISGTFPTIYKLYVSGADSTNIDIAVQSAGGVTGFFGVASCAAKCYAGRGYAPY
jgi:hypothetical protein